MKTVKQEYILMKGNEAVVHAALAAQCKCYFGYPITPQSEIPEMFSQLFPQQDGVFVQAESEIAAAGMLLGAGASGVRAMTSSSGPGLDLMQETISYMVGSELPGVFVNMSRGGPGLGSIDASQGDYIQAAKGGSHGAAKTFVLAPSTSQECYDMTIEAFDLTFKYRNPVLILGDAMVAQVKEPVLCWKPKHSLNDKADQWCLTGNKNRIGRTLKSVHLEEGALARHNFWLMEKNKQMQADSKVEAYCVEDAELILVAFGSVGRISRSAVNELRKEGHAVGLIRPCTLFPFPAIAIEKLALSGKRFLVIEQNNGQMVDDVRLAIHKHTDAELHLVPVGISVSAEELLTPILECLRRK